MGRKPSKLVDVVELELLMGYSSFNDFSKAVEATVGPTNHNSLRVYWHYHQKHGPMWRRVMRGKVWLQGPSKRAVQAAREGAK